MTALPSDWLILNWPVPAGVHAVFTSRAGGVSVPPYESLNLGTHVGDRPESVVANRAALQCAVGAHPVFLNQVHGSAVLALDAATPDGLSADACVTRQRQLVCTVMVADCLPVLLATHDGRAVAAAHAGWRGLAGVGGQGVLEAVHAALLAQAGGASSVLAWLGPCIGPSAFEVGPEVKAAFEVVQPQAAGCFVQSGAGRFLADLPALARLRLQALGVSQIDGNDGSAPWCTVGNPSRFFSHRRDAGVHGNGFGTTGRMAACIWLD